MQILVSLWLFFCAVHLLSILGLFLHEFLEMSSLLILFWIIDIIHAYNLIGKWELENLIALVVVFCVIYLLSTLTLGNMFNYFLEEYPYDPFLKCSSMYYTLFWYEHDDCYSILYIMFLVIV